MRPLVRTRCLPTGSPDAAAAFATLASLAATPAPLPVTLAPTPRGRGLVATRDVPPGALLLAVDRATTLVVADNGGGTGGRGAAVARAAAADFAALAGPPPPLLAAYAASGDPWFERLLALFLYVLFRPAGAWSLYAATLPPERHVTALAAFSPADRALLPPDLASVAARDAAALDRVHAALFDGGTGTLKALRLSPSPAATRAAAALLNSRCFSDAVGGDPLSLAVPLVDMANHDPVAPSAAFALGEGGTSFGLTATRGLSAGDEVTISYTGADPLAKPNGAYMKDYGFVVAGNPADAVPLPGAAGGGGGAPSVHAASRASMVGQRSVGARWRQPRMAAAIRAGISGRSVRGSAGGPASIAMRIAKGLSPAKAGWSVTSS